MYTHVRPCVAHTPSTYTPHPPFLRIKKTKKNLSKAVYITINLMDISIILICFLNFKKIDMISVSVHAFLTTFFHPSTIVSTVKRDAFIYAFVLCMCFWDSRILWHIDRMVRDYSIITVCLHSVTTTFFMHFILHYTMYLVYHSSYLPKLRAHMAWIMFMYYSPLITNHWIINPAMCARVWKVHHEFDDNAINWCAYYQFKYFIHKK